MTAVTALERMERTGLIVRECSSEDRRRAVVSLTPREKVLEKEITPHIEDIYKVFTASIAKKEISALKKTLETIKRNLDKDPPL